uniref:Cytochrome P450 n=1 Tax=Leersia perrieri TaxID=77586 RepID=A0A0D9VDS8_9ORYZ
MMLRLGETPLVVASSRETAREVLRTHDANFATRPRLLAGEVVLYGYADILFSPSGDYWRRLRQLCTAEVLGPKRVLSFRHIREQEMASQVEEIRAAGPSTPVDLTALFSILVINNVSRASFGNKQRNAKEFLSAVKTGGHSSKWHTLEDIHRIVDSTLEEVTEERRGAREDKAR